MTDEEIAELRRLEQAATIGPWEVGGLTPYVVHVSRDERGRRVTAYVAAYSSTTLENRANANLCAALRNAAPALLDELEHLRKIEAMARLVASAGWGTAVLSEGEHNRRLGLMDKLRAALEGK